MFDPRCKVSLTQIWRTSGVYVRQRSIVWLLQRSTHSLCEGSRMESVRF